MGTHRHINSKRIAVLTAFLALAAFGTWLHPTWPRDLAARLSTRSVDFTFSQAPLCTSERDAYQPDEIRLSADRRKVTVYASLNCADKAGSPTAKLVGGALYLSISPQSLDPDSGLAAACYCSNELTFTLSDQIVSGQEVIFVSGLQRTAAMVAP